MKNLAKLFVVTCGIVLALAATSNKSKATGKADVIAPGEGCRDTGECGTTPGGTKLNGSYTVWN